MAIRLNDSVSQKVRPTILVTGSAGFLGTHLVQRIECGDVDIATLDLVASDVERGKTVDYKIDIADRESVMRLPDLDVVYHLAAVSSPIAVAANPTRAWAANVVGTRNLVARFGDRVVFAHT